MTHPSHSAWTRYMSTAALAIGLIIVTVTLLAPAAMYQHCGHGIAGLYQALKRAHLTYQWLSASLLLHALFFGVTMLLAAAVLATYRRITVTRLLAAAGIITGYGLILELLQQFFVKGRAFELQDLMANAAGTALSLITALLLVACRRNGDTTQTSTIT
jgi:VanZ family protein